VVRLGEGDYEGRLAEIGVNERVVELVIFVIARSEEWTTWQSVITGNAVVAVGSCFLRADVRQVPMLHESLAALL
jgi:hypothetical protein